MRLNLQHANIAYQLFGEGLPIIFLHGMGMDHHSMQIPYEPILANRPYKRLYLDLPGMGASSGLATATSDAMLTTLIQAIQHLIGNQSFVLCGHSYGGYLALGLANQLPNLVQGLFLTCPVITANAQKRLTASPLNIIQEKASPTTHSEFYDDYLNMTVNINRESWHVYQQQVIPAIQAANKPFLDQLTGNHFQNYQLTFENRLKDTHYQMPLTVLVGRHDSVVGYQEQLQVATQSPQGELILLNHAGHNLPFDQPKAVAFHFRRFLSELA